MKFPGGKISQPMFKPSMTHKKEIERKIIDGEINIGIPITPIQCTTYKIDNDSKTVIEETSTIHGHHIPMIDIRRTLLNRHETLGIVRVYTDDEIDSMGDTCIKNVVENRLRLLTTNLNTMKETIRSTTRQCHLKLWHDHSEVGGHGHMLCTISCIFDPAFYLTDSEMLAKGVKINVQQIVEQPQVYILARSSSSIMDQSMFSKPRVEDISNLSSPIYSAKNVPIMDVLRYYHGDGPARQFEAGNDIGGDYPCTGCGAHYLMTLYMPLEVNHYHYLRDRNLFSKAIFGSKAYPLINCMFKI